MQDDVASPSAAGTPSPGLFTELVVNLAVSVHLPNLLQGMTTGIRSTLIPVFCRMLGASDAVIGLVTAAAGMARIICAVPAGVATERWGLLMVMTIGMIINVIGAAIGAVSFNWIALALASVVWGFAIGFFYVSRHVFLANVIGRQRRGRLMSLVGGGERWASVFGPVLGGVLIDQYGPRAAAAAIAPLSVLCTLCLWRSSTVHLVNERVLQTQLVTHQNEHTEPASVATVLKANWSVISRLGVYAANVISLRSCRKMMLPLAAMNLNMSPTYVGIVLASSFAVDATLFFLGGMIMDRFGRRYAAVPTTVNIGLGFILLSSVETVWGVFMSAIFFGFADSLGAGLLLTLTADHVPASGGPTYIGILRMVQDAGQLVGPVLAGAIIAWTSFEAACVVLGLIGIANGAWAYFLLPDEGNGGAGSQQPKPSEQEPTSAEVVGSSQKQQQHDDHASLSITELNQVRIEETQSDQEGGEEGPLVPR